MRDSWNFQRRSKEDPKVFSRRRWPQAGPTSYRTRLRIGSSSYGDPRSFISRASRSLVNTRFILRYFRAPRGAPRGFLKLLIPHRFFHRFWKLFGGLLGPKLAPKIEQKSIKNRSQDAFDFGFHFCLIFDRFGVPTSTPRSSKIEPPLRREHDFQKIAFRS